MEQSNMQSRDQYISDYLSDKSFTLFPVYASAISKAAMSNSSFFKRFMDIFISSMLYITVFSWLFPIIAILIKLTSRGPLLFIQHRIGLNNQPILCYKFRTMEHGCSNVDQEGNYLQAVKNDPRVTRFGNFLRKTSLDELPQFWNVLKGDMSIVGPRPHPKELNAECETVINNYQLRHLVKPGITGLAQIKGYRGPTPEMRIMQKRINYDVWYINNWSIGLDCKIILLTFQSLVYTDENAF